MKFTKRRTIRTRILFSLSVFLLMSSILFLTISSKEIFARKLVIDNSKIVEDNNAIIEFPSNNFFENSIYREDNITRTGSTIFVNDDLLILIEDWYGREIYNISDVNEPELAKNYSTPDIDYESTMIVQDNYLYIYIWHSIYVFDYTNPLSIVQVGRYTGLGDLSNFAINGWYLYTLSEDNFTIYNFENFSTLELQDSYFNGTHDYYDFNIKGNYSYVLTEYEGFVILDISNKTNIQYSGEILLNSGVYKSTIYIKNDNLFLFEYYPQYNLSIFNISDPLNITIMSTYLVQDRSIIDIIIRDNTLFLLDYNALLILDISDFEQIQVISNYSPPEFSTSFSSFMIQDNYAYIHNTYYGHFVSRKPLFIVNITDLESPHHVFPHDEFDFWDWLDALSKALLTLVILGFTLPILGVITILIVFFVRKRRKSVKIDQIDNQ